MLDLNRKLVKNISDNKGKGRQIAGVFLFSIL